MPCSVVPVPRLGMVDRMTVLVVMPLAEQFGGGELMLRHLVQYGHGHGVAWVVVFLEDGPMVSDLRQCGSTVFVVRAGRLRNPLQTIAAITQITRLIRRVRATLVVGWMEKGHLYAGPAAMLTGRPAVWYQLGTAKRRKWLARVATGLPARGVITLSRECARAQGAIRPVRRQRMVYPGAELDRFAVELLATPEELRARLQLPSKGPLIGIVSRLQRWKGVHVVIDAMALLRQSHPEAHCVVVGGAHDGEPDYPGTLARQVDSLGLTSHVTFAGLQPNVPEWMQAMDIVVHASDHEPFGIVVIEAMALGKPVVAGSEGGPREIVTDRVDGLLVPYGDSSALAAAVRRYLDNPEFATAVGAAACIRARDFSVERYAANVIHALRELTER